MDVMKDLVRIAYLSHARIPSRSANSVHVMKMCEGFTVSGCDVTLFARTGDDAAGLTPSQFYGTTDLVRLAFIAEHPSVVGRMLYSWNAARRARSHGAQFAVGRDLAGCYAAAVLGLPVCYETHNPASHLQGIKRYLFTRLLRHPNFRQLIVITTVLKDTYVHEFGLDASRILVLPDAASEPGSTSRTLPANGRFTVGYLGHLYPGRGVDVIASLAEHCEWADFHVVGGRDEEVRAWRDRCRGQSNLTFHGFVPHAQAAGYLASFDVVLAPYQARVTVEGKGDTSAFMSPLKLFEYMAARRAILCSDLPVLGDVMRHDANCLLAPAGDLSAWRAALLRLKDEPGLRARLADQAYADFRHAYTWSARAERVLVALTAARAN